MQNKQTNEEEALDEAQEAEEPDQGGGSVARQTEQDQAEKHDDPILKALAKLQVTADGMKVDLEEKIDGLKYRSRLAG